MTTLQQVDSSSQVLALRFGQRDSVSELAQRILDFLPGAKDVPAEGRLALAQIALAHGLDPFLGEVWAIPQRERETNRVIGFQLMIGIAGWRAHAHRSGSYAGRVFQLCTPEERKMLGCLPDDLAMKCIITRRAAGQHPMNFDGYGIFRTGKERTKMNPLQCVRTRAERDAMKSAFPLGLSGGMMGAPVRVVDEGTGEIIDGGFSPTDQPVEPVADSFPAPTEQVPEESETTTPTDENARPYSPDVLKAKLSTHAEVFEVGGREATKAQRGLFASMLEQCFAPDTDAEKKRRGVQLFLFGTSSATNISHAQILAGLRWLNVAKDEDGHYAPDALAVREAQAVWALAEVGIFSGGTNE